MIDDSAVRAALESVLVHGPIPAEDIARLGDFSFTPPTDRPHLRVSLLWQRKGKTGAALTEGEGIWQVLVFAAEGTPAGAVEALAMSLGLFFEPFVDGPQLAAPVEIDPVQKPFVRITDVQTLTTVSGPDGEALGGRRWVITPLQVDFRLELIPDGIA